MPIYEFECEECGERSEALVDMGTTSIECRHCGAASTHRVLSAQAPSTHLVKTPSENRRQERSNAQLNKDTKARFKATRQRQRDAKAKRQGGKPG